MKSLTHGIVAVACFFCLSVPAFAQLEIDWYTIDNSGGGMNSSGGPYELSGTIGQPIAGTNPPMSGGDFELSGGFWAGAVVSACTCPADMNADDAINGMDIQLFVHCMLGSGSNCACANVDQTGGLDLADIDGFVNDLLAFKPCP